MSTTVIYDRRATYVSGGERRGPRPHGGSLGRSKLPPWLHRAHREEVAGPKLVGGGDTREEVGVAAVPLTLGVYREEDAKGQT